MLKFSNLVGVAVANQGRATFSSAKPMEADTISKNGRSLKSQMSRGKILICLVLSVFVISAVFVSCKKEKFSGVEKMKQNADQVKYIVNPPVLELVSDQVIISVYGSYPAGYFDENVIVTLTPVLKNGVNEQAFETYKVQGEAVKENNKVIKIDGGSFSFTSHVGYHPNFQLSELILNISASNSKGTETIDFDPVKLADGIIITCLLVEKNGKTTYASDNYDHNGLSDQEINSQFDSDPSKLKLEEILYAGTLTQDANRKLAVYQAAVRYYPNDYRTKNNLGVALLILGRTSEAKTVLNEAKNIENNETVKNNLAVVALREGNLAAVEELLNTAGLSDDAKFNLGTVKIIQGLYNEAISLFGNQVEINVALAKLLAKQNDAALSTLNSVRSDDALIYYLKAIVGARIQNNDMLMNNLRTACSKSTDLKARAKKDIEFVKYFQNDTFISIIN